MALYLITPGEAWLTLLPFPPYLTVRLKVMFAFVALAWLHQFILQTVCGKYLGTEMLMVNISISMFPCFIVLFGWICAVCKGPGIP